MIVILKHKINNLLDLYSPNISYDYHCIINIMAQGNHKVLVAHQAYVGDIITILVFQITGTSLHHRIIQDLHHNIHVYLQQGPRGNNFHIHCILDQKTNFGNPCDWNVGT